MRAQASRRELQRRGAGPAATPRTALAHTADGAVIGRHDAATQTYQPLLGLTLLGTWSAMPTLLVNGKAITRTWITTNEEGASYAY